LPIIEKVFKEHAPSNFRLGYTAGKEWFKHGMWSLHHSGNALDIRTKTLPDRGVGDLSAKIARILRTALAARLGSKSYTVLYNDQGSQEPHIHVQFNKGERWSQPGDYGIGESRKV
jgi:hypothetical protein